MKRSIAALTGLLLVFAFVSPLPAAKSSTPYTYLRTGNSYDIAVSRTTPGTVLMGGSTDVDAAFQWMCARSGGGDFLVIRATGTEAYNPYIRQLCPGSNSVATLIIPTIDAANHPDVAKIIQAAEAIWIAGGDQSNYINYWTGTPVQAAIQAQIARGVPVGGTSAGLNVLSEFVYSAQANKGVTSSQALANPFNRYMSFARDFLDVPFLSGLIGDPHFAERDRMGRDLAFLCRIWDMDKSIAAPRAVSVDEQTALLVDEGGMGTVAGAGAVYFLQAPGAPEVCKSDTPLTYRDIGVYRIGAAGGSFDLRAWRGRGGTSYSVSAVDGVLSSTQENGSLY